MVERDPDAQAAQQAVREFFQNQMTERTSVSARQAGIDIVNEAFERTIEFLAASSKAPR